MQFLPNLIMPKTTLKKGKILMVSGSGLRPCADAEALAQAPVAQRNPPSLKLRRARLAVTNDDDGESGLRPP
jgi:hypothetical protein